MNRQAQAVVMLLFGGALLRAGLTDLYLRYVKEGLRPFVIAAGAVLVTAAVMTLWYDLRGRSTRPAGGHGHHEPRVGWLLLLPVLGLLLIAPPALGADAAGKSGTVLSASSASEYPPLPPGDPVRIGLVEYATRVVFDEGRGMSGRTVELTGFISAGPDGRPMLTRMVLSCCAADGRPIKIGMTGKVPAGLSPDTWVRVAGAYTPHVEQDAINGAKVPYVEVKSWEKIDPPKRQYE